MTEQIERKLDHEFKNKPWHPVKHSHKRDKITLHRRERQRAKLNPKCPPEYTRYNGWEW